MYLFACHQMVKVPTTLSVGQRKFFVKIKKFIETTSECVNLGLTQSLENDRAKFFAQFEQRRKSFVLFFKAREALSKRSHTVGSDRVGETVFFSGIVNREVN